MKVDLIICGTILKRLAALHPNQPNRQEIEQLEAEVGEPDTFLANLHYLQEHSLISESVQFDQGWPVLVKPPLITKGGIDFIRVDGGLTAILNSSRENQEVYQKTLSVLTQLIQDLAPPEQKTGLISRLQSLPADAIKHLSLKIVDMGVAGLPGALQLIEKALHSL